MSYIGINGVSRLAPEGKFDINKAEQMAKDGYNPTVIKIQTGWEQGIDGFGVTRFKTLLWRPLP